MEEEKVIRDEANYFFKTKLSGRRQQDTPIVRFHELKDRLNDFYSPQYKAIFLDEVEKNIIDELIGHRKQAHNGLPKPDCPYEMNAEKLLFYIKQEIDTFPKIAHQNVVTNPTFTRNKVFISYSHNDVGYLNDIKRHFKPFLTQIDFWDDSKISPGQKWREEIRKAINETKIAILLLSTDFLGSDFISSDELPPLLSAAEEDGAVILSVIVRPCLFEEFPAINQYQAMNPPSRPVSKMDSEEKEELFVNLVRQTKRILSSSES